MTSRAMSKSTFNPTAELSASIWKNRTALQAKRAVWIVAEPRPEHVAAITWLNESSAASFYLLKLEGIRINDSAPAPLLTLIVGPSEEGREVGETKKDLAEQHILRNKFWSELLRRAKERTKLHANISPSHQSWISTGLNFHVCESA
jgi:hypothetical protein